MSRVRVLGPVLMIVLGAAMLIGPGSMTGTAGAGSQSPCQPKGASAAGEIVIPDDCCYDGPIAAGFVYPTTCGGRTPITFPPSTEMETTTTQMTSTSTVTSSTPEETTTTEGVPTSEVTSTTAGGDVSGGNVSSDSGGSAAPATTTLARTGTGTTEPMTVAGISLIALGAGLLLVGRRRSALQG